MSPPFPSLTCGGCGRLVPAREIRMVLGHDRAVYLCPTCRNQSGVPPEQREGRWKARQCDCVFRDAEDCALFRLGLRPEAPPLQLPFCRCRCHSI